MLARYLAMPSWVLVLHLFLTLGWTRAAVAHTASAGWWSGDEVRQFAADHESSSLGLYRIVLGELVAPLATATSIAVLAAQVTIAWCLLVNRRPGVGLALGAFLNLQFVLAGQVNPSVFYLLMTMAIIAWRVEARLTMPPRQWTAVAVTVIAVVVAVVVAPGIGTVDPALVIDDPALIVMLLAVLSVAVAWSIVARHGKPHGDGEWVNVPAFAELDADNRRSRENVPY